MKQRRKQETGQFPAVPAAVPPRKSRKGLIAGGVIGGILLLAAALFGVAVVCVGNVETVYPNVSIGGVPLGGQYYDEAVISMDLAGWHKIEAPAVTVDIPGGGFSVSYAQAGMVCDGETAAQIAYDYGRSGNAVSSTLTYLRCLVSGKDLTEEVFGPVDEDLIEGIVQVGVAEAQANLLDDVEIDVEAGTVTVIKGASYIHLDAGEVFELVIRAIKGAEFGTVTYEPETVSETELDVPQLREQICAEKKDAYYDKGTDSIIPEVVGIDFQPGDAKSAWDTAQLGAPVTIPVTVDMPEVTKESLEALLFSTVLAEKGTSLAGSSSNRINNVEKAAAALNGIVLMPGEQLSYNEALGQRTKENGYLAAGAYANGAVVQEIGGGICQVSSTLYYCTLQANLQIDKRTCHYFPVGYLPPGFDATVSWTNPDFKFTNDREYPIRITAWVEDGQVFVKIEGTDDGTYVELKNSSWLMYTNDEFPEVATGYKAQAYRWVYDSKTGELIEKKSEGVSTYNYHAEDIKYPEPEPSPEPTPEPTTDPVFDPWAPTPTPDPTVPPDPAATPSPEPTPEPTPETGTETDDTTP